MVPPQEAAACRSGFLCNAMVCMMVYSPGSAGPPAGQSGPAKVEMWNGLEMVWAKAAVDGYAAAYLSCFREHDGAM